MSGFKSKFIRQLSNIIGWCTDRRIVVFESDDWGSIRIPSKEVYSNLVANNINMDGSIFTKYDSLESNEDVSKLLDLISKFKDYNGTPPVITGLCIVTNPNFERIKADNFESYHYELCTETLKKYPGREQVFDLLINGVEENLFFPQFHGREHLNVQFWMTDLRKKIRTTHLAFQNGLTGIPAITTDGFEKDYQAAFDITTLKENEYLKEVLVDGMDIFEKVYGFRSEYFVPPNGPFSSHLNSVLVKSGIKYLNVAKIRKEPIGKNKYTTKIHYLGQQQKGLTHITRNAIFEPSKKGVNWVDRCLSDISIAFQWKKPAVISSHRVNYIGSIDEKNSENGLKELKRLISAILKKWPDVEFMTSKQLGDLIKGGSEKIS